MLGTARDRSSLHRLVRENTSGAKVNGKNESSAWVDVCQQITKRGASVFVYVNNHCSGHAPATVAQFLELWGKEESQ
jgi:uncharacterized protein YecE (DUF72 family)